jgi:hypothetical protein
VANVILHLCAQNLVVAGQAHDSMCAAV